MSTADKLAQALRDVLVTLNRANQHPGPITDTIWHGPGETLFDFIDITLAAHEAEKASPAASGALFFAYDEDAGFETYPTAQAAEDAANEGIQAYREHAHADGWYEEVENVCWGMVIQRARMVDLGPAPDGSEFASYVDYKLMDIAAPAAPVAVPLRAPCATCNGMGYEDSQGTAACGKCGGEGSAPVPMWQQMGAESAEQWEEFKAWRRRQEGVRK